MRDKKCEFSVCHFESGEGPGNKVASKIAGSSLAFFYLAFLSRISHFFYLASRIFLSRISHFLSSISHFYLASRIFYLAFTSRNFFSSRNKSHLECPLQASVRTTDKAVFHAKYSVNLSRSTCHFIHVFNIRASVNDDSSFPWLFWTGTFSRVAGVFKTKLFKI